MLLLQLLSSASVAFMIATWFGPVDDEARALTLSGSAAVPGWMYGFSPPSGWHDFVALLVVLPCAPLLVWTSLTALPPSRSRTKANLIRALHFVSWLVAAWIVLREAAPHGVD